MASLTFNCPRCGTVVIAEGEETTALCPSCQRTLQVPPNPLPQYGTAQLDDLMLMQRRSNQYFIQELRAIARLLRTVRNILIFWLVLTVLALLALLASLIPRN